MTTLNEFIKQLQAVADKGAGDITVCFSYTNPESKNEYGIEFDAVWHNDKMDFVGIDFILAKHELASYDEDEIDEEGISEGFDVIVGDGTMESEEESYVPKEPTVLNKIEGFIDKDAESVARLLRNWLSDK